MSDTRAYSTSLELTLFTARDNATPCAQFFAKVDESLSCPVPATVFCALLTTGLGAIQLGSKVAFTVLVSSFITLTTASYLLAILPNVLTRRSNIPKGPFWMSGALGYIVNVIACILIVFFNVWFCFPFAYPVTVSLMNCRCTRCCQKRATLTRWQITRSFSSV